MFADELQITLHDLNYLCKNLPHILVAGLFDVSAQIHYQLDMSPTLFHFFNMGSTSTNSSLPV
jgi:hypothetical protein